MMDARIRRLARRAAATAVVAAVVPSLAAAQVAFDHLSAAGTAITKTVIADGVYQFTTLRDSYVRQLNSTVIVTDSDVVVFDTNTRPTSARLILAEIRKITSKPVRFVVNSHAHPDHWSGNSVYVDAFPGVDIIASERSRAFMIETASLWAPRFADELKSRRAAFDEEVRTGKRADGAPLTQEQRRQDEDDLDNYRKFAEETAALRRVLPTMTFGDSLTLIHGGREVRLFTVTGDQEGTTVLYLPQEKILLAGDAVSFPIPYVSPRPSAQLRDLEQLSRLDVNVIVPGHGPAFRDKTFLDLERRLLASVIRGVADARQEGVAGVEEMQRRITVPELHDAFVHGDPDLDARYRARVRDLVALAFREMP